jgi:hypothetical protein
VRENTNIIVGPADYAARPVYDLYEGDRYLGHADGIDNAERFADNVLHEDQADEVEIRLNGRLVERAAWVADGETEFTTFGRRRDLR